MPNALVCIADGSEEIEAVTVIDVLRRAGVDVVVAGVDGIDVRASRGVHLRADTTLASVSGQTFDLVVLPGGKAGAERLREHPQVRVLVQRQHQAQRLLGAICAAPMVLAAAGVLAGRRATSYPGFLQPGDAELRTDAVVSDGHIITSRGPATAMAFALALVARLCGESVAAEQARALLLEPHPAAG